MASHPQRWLRALLADHADYQLASALFLRVIGLIYLAAFASSALEITGLVGGTGILPAGEYLAYAQARHDDLAWLRLPTLFWITHSDWSLLAASYAGCLLAVLLVLGWRPLLSTLLLFVLYLSLFRVGQLFFNFQWDYLLLEAGLLAIFLTQGPSRLLIFLFHWLLFRLRFLSGLSKVLSGDPSWSGLTTLQHYFETQPLPHVGAWYAHHLPESLLRFGTGATLFAELIVPFFIFLPRPFRLFAAGATILIQLAIIATSNHNFINLLTIALCLFLLDDRALRWLPEKTVVIGRTAYGGLRNLVLKKLLLPPLAVLVVVGSTVLAIDAFTELAPPSPLMQISRLARGWGQGNIYHVFPNMQTERQELVIEGSMDGHVWQPYRFRFKPSVGFDGLRFIVPLHPRLDWMIWFVPTQNPAMRPWFESLLWRLREGSPAVTALLASNPFAEKPPRYIRVQAYTLRFSTPAERQRDKRYWQTRYLGEFPRVPPRSP